MVRTVIIVVVVVAVVLLLLQLLQNPKPVRGYFVLCPALLRALTEPSTVVNNA
jgi:hypothetical protein